MKNIVSRMVAGAALVVGLSSFTGDTDAAVPGGITQQGRLLDAAGDPVSGTVQFLFRIYDSPSGGSALWEETQDITMDEGYFSVRLGDDGGNLFPTDLFDGKLVYVGVKIGTDEEMVPRERVGSVPYAFLANQSDVAINATGDITPNSLTVNGVEIIDSNGDLHGFSRVVQNVTGTTVTGSANTRTVAEANCPANHVIVGGGCAFESSNSFGGEVKRNRPLFGSNRWQCDGFPNGAEDSDGNTLALTPYAICLPD